MVDLTNHGAALDVEEPPGTDGATAVAVHAPNSVDIRAFRSIALGVAMVVALGTAVWAIWSGDSVPLALMLLYCMLVSTLALYTATAASGAPANPGRVASEPAAAGTS